MSRAGRFGIRLALPALSGSGLLMRGLVLCVRFERFLGVLWELPTAQQTSIYRTDERKWLSEA